MHIKYALGGYREHFKKHPLQTAASRTPADKGDHDMSYSITATAATKDEAGKKVEEQLAQVVASQPVHEFDRQTAQNAAEAVLSIKPR